MTAQISDTIRIAGREVRLNTLPLNHWFEQTGTKPDFKSPHTALWRGYVATWEIVDDRLYLVDLESHLADGGTGTLGDLFPGFPDRVFAHWYSGVLSIPQGKVIGYIHAGFGPIYESTLCLTIRDGMVVERRVEATDTTGL